MRFLYLVLGLLLGYVLGQYVTETSYINGFITVFRHADTYCKDVILQNYIQEIFYAK